MPVPVADQPGEPAEDIRWQVGWAKLLPLIRVLFLVLLNRVTEIPFVTSPPAVIGIIRVRAVDRRVSERQRAQGCGRVVDELHRVVPDLNARIGLIAGPHGFRSAKERRDGFELALAEAGISLPRSLIADGQYTFESGQSASESLFDLSPRPTAIFASNDEMAAGVLYAARQRGIAVPEELSIIGFDDTPLTTRVWPPLSTVRWPIVAMGRAAALKLIGTAIGEGSEVNEPSMFSSTLIRRASVAPPASS